MIRQWLAWTALGLSLGENYALKNRNRDQLQFFWQAFVVI